MQDRHTNSIRARWFSILIHGELFQTPCAGFFNFYMGTLVCTQVQDRHTNSIRARWFSILIHGELFQTPCAGFFNFYMGT